MKRLTLSIALALATPWVLAAPVEVIDQRNLEKRVSRLERMLENPVLLQLSDRLAEQQKEIQAMQDRIDRLEFRLRQQRSQHQRQLEALQGRIDELEARLKQLGAAEGDKTPSDTEKEAGQDEADVTGAYDAAMQLLRKGKYAEAAEAFDAFLKKHPDADLAPNAAYWAGEAYMVLLKFKSALARFDRVIKDYPSSGKYHDSLYRSAEALYKLGRKQDAIARLNKLLADKKAPDELKKRARTQLEKWRGKKG